MSLLILRAVCENEETEEECQKSEKPKEMLLRGTITLTVLS